jgi:hypothetical protein
MDDIDPQVLEEIRHIQMLIGRNILVFQNVEHLLKNIHYFRQGAGTENNLAKRKIKIDELSLGRLSDKTVLNKIDSKLSSKSDSELHWSYDILKDDQALNSAIKFFNDINDDRNFLVHNFTAKWPLDETENRAQARTWLLSQYDAIFAQRGVLVTSLNIIVERTNAMSEYFNSDEGKKALEKFISSEESQDVTFTFRLQT